MSDDDCIHGLGPRAGCVICNGTMDARRHQEPERTFHAKYPGHCGECDLPIVVGQMIVWQPGGQPRHEDCAS